MAPGRETGQNSAMYFGGSGRKAKSVCGGKRSVPWLADKVLGRAVAASRGRSLSTLIADGRSADTNSRSAGIVGLVERLHSKKPRVSIADTIALVMCTT